jgi:hypothetical protein
MVVRAAELPPPRSISSANFDVICRTFQIKNGDRDSVRRHLDEITGRIRGADPRGTDSARS